MRYVISLSYNGAALNGWQIQPDVPTVQSLLEDALSKLLHEKIAVAGAGRTDAGVNAINYVAHFDSEKSFDAEDLGYKLNAILPSDIVVHALLPAAPDFHSRYQATQREYTYFLHRIKDPFVNSFSFFCHHDLDFWKMNEAAALLVGRHNFCCFKKLGVDGVSPVCAVSFAGWVRYTPTHVSLLGFSPAAGKPGLGPLPSEDCYWYFRISADRFLRNMVRSIVGTLLEVGRGKRSVEDFASLILPPDALTPEGRLAPRCRAGESVPGYPLFLDSVKYL